MKTRAEAFLASTRPVVAGGIRVNAYEVFARAVETAIEYGWNRAHKHNDEPSADTIKGEIETAIMNDVCEVFFFDAPEEKP